MTPFSRRWVGGDIQGLRALAGQCDAVVAEVSSVDTTLTNAVRGLITAGSWHGTAAEAFTSRWDADSRAGQQLADAWAAIGKIIGELAVSLADLESRLKEAACQLERQGIAVDQSTGVPLPDVTAGMKSNIAPERIGVTARLAADYSGYRDEILNAARTAREATAVRLAQIAEQLIPVGRDWGQLANDANALRSLWGIPTSYRAHLQDVIPETEANLLDTEDSALRYLLQNPSVNGNRSLLPKEIRTSIADAKAEKAALESKLGYARAMEPASSKVASGDADALGLTADAPGLMRVVGGAVEFIPLAGMLAGTGITIWQDLRNHESMGHAVEDGASSGVASIGGGIAGGAGGQFIANAVLAAGPETAVVATVAGGVIGAVGVGDFVHHVWQENWNSDWHQYGVFGLGHGVADSFDKTRHDMAHYGDDIIHLL
jgi:uncharacterized protein YukE